MEQHKRIYTLRLTERQAKLFSYACDQFSRLICGQDWSYIEPIEDELKATRIVDLPFSIRVLNCLKSADIETLYDLLRVSKTSLFKIKNFGKNSLAEIDNYFKENGYQWGTEFLEYRSTTSFFEGNYYLPKKE